MSSSIPCAWALKPSQSDGSSVWASCPAKPTVSILAGRTCLVLYFFLAVFVAGVPMRLRKSNLDALQFPQRMTGHSFRYWPSWRQGRLGTRIALGIVGQYGWLREKLVSD